MDKNPQFKLTGASVRGHYHRYANNQDAFVHGSVEVDGAIFHYGLVSDGCGSSKHSEIGSKLTIRFSQDLLTKALKGETAGGMFKKGKQLDRLPGYLLSKLISHIGLQAAMACLPKKDLLSLLGKDETSLVDPRFIPHRENIQEYLNEIWLATLIGFVIGPDFSVVFHQGDGVYMVNDVQCLLRQNNKPHYPAYYAMPWFYQAFANPPQISKVEFPTASMQHIVIGSDAWLDHLDMLSRVPDLYRSGPMVEARMKVWLEDTEFDSEPEGSTAREAFRDDATIVCAKRIAPSEN